MPGQCHAYLPARSGMPGQCHAYLPARSGMLWSETAVSDRSSDVSRSKPA
jgi:hypothetical protein